jgi:hypothetical protein
MRMFIRMFSWRGFGRRIYYCYRTNKNFKNEWNKQNDNLDDGNYFYVLFWFCFLILFWTNVCSFFCNNNEKIIMIMLYSNHNCVYINNKNYCCNLKCIEFVFLFVIFENVVEIEMQILCWNVEIWSANSMTWNSIIKLQNLVFNKKKHPCEHGWTRKKKHIQTKYG